MTAAPTHTFSLSGLKTFRGHEGHGFNAWLIMDGKKIAYVIDEANGGAYYYESVDKEAFAAFEAHVASLPVTVSEDPYIRKLFPEGMEQTDETFIGALVDAALQEKQMKGWCKTKVVFRLKGDDEGSWRTIKAPFDARVKAHLVDKHGDKLEEILNERFAK